MLYHVETLADTLSAGRKQFTHTDQSNLLQATLMHYRDDLGYRFVSAVPAEEGNPFMVYSVYQTGDKD